jgi:hypothetical protein
MLNNTLEHDIGTCYNYSSTTILPSILPTVLPILPTVLPNIYNSPCDNYDISACDNHTSAYYNYDISACDNYDISAIFRTVMYNC